MLDASVALTFVLRDEDDDAAARLLSSVRRATIIAPMIWRAEVLNGLLNAQRRKRIDAAGIQQGIALIDGLDVEVDLRPIDLSAIHQLATRYRLTVYDALYLDLAAREGVGLATHDDDLKRAAKAANVTII
ncbi:MAG: type II toxin-antitoxin system VapC family toxin [Burkholderiaceae bacterium]